MAQNEAAWLSEKGVPLKVGPATMPTAGPNEVVIKNHAVAINPIDVAQATTGRYVKQYPTVLGHDVAGEIFEVGSGVTAFKPGDRVIGHAWQMRTSNPEDAGFALYTKIDARNVAILPSNITYADGAVLPLSLDTATAALYQSRYLGLELPTSKSSPTGQTIVIYGGSSSIGLSAAQLAKASGLRVISIASSRNFDLCKLSGASEVFDYRSSSLVDDVLKAIGKNSFAGIFNAICSEASWNDSFKIMQPLGGGKIAASQSPPESLPANVQSAQVFGLGEFAYPLWQNFLGAALASGQIKPLPEPLIVGRGLESIQAGVERYQAGISAQKVVIEL